MSRMIDADALMVELMDSDLDHLQRDDWKEVIQIVQDAPTITPEPHWIPVTERLPKKSGRYYVTEQAYNVDDRKHEGVCWTTTDMADYSAKEKRWIRARFLKIVAWMEREPYKGVNT